MIQALKSLKKDLHPLIDVDIFKKNILILDFSENNHELRGVDLTNPKAFSDYVFGKMKKQGAFVAIGRYNENRIIYRSELFKQTKSPRTIHIGLDLWSKSGTPVFAPLTGKIHSFKNNATIGDYGPTIILEHQVGDIMFYTLYGHLSLDSLDNIREGQPISKGQEIARIGNYPTNGNWSPHLHFQIITDMMGKKGDFYGVVSPDEREKFLEICPDPNVLLGIEALHQ
jgi:murein DD-endopeptidase MepM/ murein hydrolase activator NlpD